MVGGGGIGRFSYLHFGSRSGREIVAGKHNASCSTRVRCHEPVSGNTAGIIADQALARRRIPFELQRAAPRRGFHAANSLHTLREVRHLEPGGFRFSDCRTVQPAQTTPECPFRSPTISDSWYSSRRSRPERAFVMTSTTAPCARLHSVSAEMRCPGSDPSLRRRRRRTSHDRAIHGPRYA